MKAASSFGVRPEAVNAFLALADVLTRMSDNGRRPVCEQRPEQWSSDATTPARQDAAAACGYCPAQPACLAYALAQREPQGVFGGRDFTPTPKRKEKAA
ncbi:WhiB family transcriptional regulator [Nocardioides sp.]|uniref:WhiB family transcriptional regulator n=1 Tax=Nocardioides sp. TaxID=35761 RepID=UPI002609F173|nr:WhiB family transcriptional regulator [Nocardioides sp.]MCW2738868.1 Transcription factor WhiB [Nocardioides sp.]